MAKRSAHTSPKGQRVGAKIVLWRPIWKERTARGLRPLFLSAAEFSVARRAGRQRTARGRAEDAGRQGRAPDKRWFHVGNWSGRVAAGVRFDVLTPSLLFSGEPSKASSRRYFL